MVKIAIAGGSGNVAQEVIDALVATKKHEILLLSRKDAPSEEAKRGRAGVIWAKASYEDPKQLLEALQGVDTVLSFIVTHSDPGNLAQKSLIDAAVRAGVRRFAPSEWATSTFEYMTWYDGKAEIREYLRQLNKDKKVLEYTLFQPGLFLDYLCYPYKSSKHIHPFETPFNFNERRALILEGSDNVLITLTTAEDLANVVTRAVEYEGRWPLVSGIKGNELTIRQIIALGEKIRGALSGTLIPSPGGPFKVEGLRADDLKAGVVECSWMPKADHPSLTPEQVDALSKSFLAGMLLGISSGALSVTDEWNQLLPDYEFTEAEEFLSKVWRDKP